MPVIHQANLDDATGRIEALIAEARENRRRRLRRLALIVTGIAVAVVVGATAIAIPTLGGFGGGHEAGAGTLAPTRTGVVTGFIEPCVGFVLKMPPYPGGRVVALRGTVHLKRIASGASKPILPTAVVTREQVKTDQRFVLRLPPGDYVVLARSDQGVTSWLSVSIKLNVVKVRNLPNPCK